LLVVGIEITVTISTTYYDTKSSGNTPATKMIPLLEELRFSVSSYDHLVEVEGNAESPTEIGDEHKMQNNCHENTRPCITSNPTSSSENESKETNTNSHAEITNELNRVSTDVFEEQESDEC
jgi:hypothetical protein